MRHHAMNTKIYCITGKKRLKAGASCQECNGFHDPLDPGTPRLITSVRTVAHMLHGDEITPRDAAITLFALTEARYGKPRYHSRD